MKTESKTARQLIKEAEAGVARASFYRNYGSVKDVLNDIMNKITSEIL